MIGENIASLTMSARVQHFSSAPLRAVKEERDFALMDGVAFSNRRLARNRFQVRNSVRPMHLFGLPHTHLHSLRREIAIKLFRFLPVLQSPFLKLPGIRIHKRNLLKARVVVCSYDDHVRLLSPEPVGWIQHHQLYSGVEADIVIEINYAENRPNRRHGANRRRKLALSPGYGS